MSEQALKPCSCGNPVELKYCCGFSRSLLKEINNPFAGSMPRYYVYCEKCGENMVIEFRESTVHHGNKCKRKIIREWNKKANDLNGK